MAAPHAGTHTEPRFVRRIQHKSAGDVALHFRACAPSAPTKSMAYVTHPRTNCRRSVTKAVGKSSEYLGLKTPKAQNEQMFSGLPPKADAAEPYLPLPTRADSRLIRRSKGVPGVANLPATDLAAALRAARTASHALNARHPRSAPIFAFRLKVPPEATSVRRSGRPSPPFRPIRRWREHLLPSWRRSSRLRPNCLHQQRPVPHRPRPSRRGTRQ